jgi:hypothetical protein
MQGTTIKKIKEMFYVWKTARKFWTDDSTTFRTEQLVELNWRKEMRSEFAVYIIQMWQKRLFDCILKWISQAITGLKGL